MLVRALIFSLCVLTLASCQLVPHPCLYQESCLCDSQSIRCECKGDEIINLRPFLNMTGPMSITIEGCNEVNVRFGAFWYMNVQSLEFKNINRLNIEHFILTRAAHISKFVLENISDFVVALFALTGFVDTDTVVFRNVTARNFTQYAVIGMGVELFMIENSRLNIQPFSIILANVKEFIIRSTYFDHISNTSILIQTASRVIIHNSEFASAEPRSFILFHIDNLKVSKCLFDVLPYGFFWGNVENFFFQRNHIESSETDSFLQLGVNNSAEFKFNVFKNLEENSIFPNPDNNISSTVTSLEFAGNKIHCDCRLSWIFNNVKVYLPFIQSGVCQNYKSLKISQLLELIHSNKTCNFSGYKELKTVDLDKINFLPQEDERIPVSAALNYKTFVNYNPFLAILFLFTFFNMFKP